MGHRPALRVEAGLVGIISEKSRVPRSATAISGCPEGDSAATVDRRPTPGPECGCLES